MNKTLVVEVVLGSASAIYFIVGIIRALAYGFLQWELNSRPWLDKWWEMLGENFAECRDGTVPDDPQPENTNGVQS